MPGPVVFVGLVTVASFLAGSQDEEREERRLERLGLGRRRRTNKPYRFEIDCISSDGDSINEMRGSQAVEVSYDTMLRHCDLISWAREHGYEARKDQGSGITLEGDPYVSYHRSFYQGKPCYYLVWSGIEQVFVLRD